MAEGRRGSFVERRKGHDRLLRIMSWSGLAGWAIMLAVMVVVDRAKPDDPAFIPNKRIFEQAGVPYHLRTTWDQGLVTYIFYLLIAGLVLGIAGLALNSRRHRRRDDHYRIHLVLLTGISAVGVLYYLIF
jgi:Flp pilus assembly protein protease CpaA